MAQGVHDGQGHPLSKGEEPERTLGLRTPEALLWNGDRAEAVALLTGGGGRHVNHGARRLASRR